MCECVCECGSIDAAAAGGSAVDRRGRSPYEAVAAALPTTVQPS